MKTKNEPAQKFRFRDERGSLGILIPLSILLGILGLGAFSADISHNISVRAQMQSATDAGALAGAAALMDPLKAPLASYNASRVTAMNSADGVYVSNTSPGTNVSVSVNTNVPGEYGTVTVRASQPIQNWLASLLGHTNDTITVTSVAAASKTVNAVCGQKGDILGGGLDPKQDANLATMSPSSVRLIQNPQGF